MMNKVLLKDLKNFFSAGPYIFLVGIGFDPRCLTAIENIGNSNNTQIYGIANMASNDHQETENERRFREITEQKSHIFGLQCNSIIEIIDEIHPFIKQIDFEKNKLLLDITSLSHELLTALIGLFASEGKLNNITVLYTGASHYSFNMPEDKLWLSNGVTDIRSILGFPGFMLPSRKSHLIVMAGFEVERAAEVIRRYEPSRLTIAWGSKDQSVHDHLYKSNIIFAERLKSFIAEQDCMTEHFHQFEFSCIDPFDTAKAIANHIDQYPKENTVIVPLNTKLSTIGAALAALKNPEIQICYAQAAVYNTAGYAVPGDTVTIVPLENS